MDDFYIYSHQDKEGNVFYIGKGTGRRAWQRERHPMWEKYVDRIGGNYEVKLLMDNLSENDALHYEERIMSEQGGKLVNWINPGRKVNMKILDRYWNERKENETRFERVKETEKTDINLAIAQYNEILEKMYGYEKDDLSEAESYLGLAKEVYKEFWMENQKYNNGNMEMLDRITICLKKNKDLTELKTIVLRYVEVFPNSIDRAQMKVIFKRIKLN